MTNAFIESLSDSDNHLNYNSGETKTDEDYSPTLENKRQRLRDPNQVTMLIEPSKESGTSSDSRRDKEVAELPKSLQK